MPDSDVLEMPARAETVRTMAQHLVAAILHARLDTSNEIDVIECLRHTPERYNWRIIHNHMDEALFEAKQTLIAVEISRP